MSKLYGGIPEPGMVGDKKVWGHAGGVSGSTPYQNPENILRKTGMFGVLKVVGGKVVMPTDPPDKINQFGLIDPKDVKPGDSVYYPDLLNDLQLTDHYPLLQQTAIGTVCTLNLMKQCEAFAGGGHNNGFGKVETPEQYQARLDKLADLIIAMVKENGITAFTFQEAPNGVEGKAFYEKIERATGCKFVEDDKSRNAGLVTLFDPKKITPVLTKPGDEKSHKVVSATKEAREQQVEFSKVGASATDKTLLVTNVHWQLDKAPAGLERMKAAMTAANDPNAKHDLLVLGDTNFCANAHAIEKLGKVKGGPQNAAAHAKAVVDPTMIGAGATSYVEGSLSASKGGVTTADIVFGSAGMVGPSHGSAQQPLVHTGDPAFQVALEEARKDNVSHFDPGVAAKMNAVAGQENVEKAAAKGRKMAQAALLAYLYPSDKNSGSHKADEYRAQKSNDPLGPDGLVALAKQCFGGKFPAFTAAQDAKIYAINVKKAPYILYGTDPVELKARAGANADGVPVLIVDGAKALPVPVLQCAADKKEAASVLHEIKLGRVADYAVQQFQSGNITPEMAHFLNNEKASAETRKALGMAAGDKVVAGPIDIAKFGGSDPKGKMAAIVDSAPHIAVALKESAVYDRFGKLYDSPKECVLVDGCMPRLGRSAADGADLSKYATQNIDGVFTILPTNEAALKEIYKASLLVQMQAAKAAGAAGLVVNAPSAFINGLDPAGQKKAKELWLEAAAEASKDPAFKAPPFGLVVNGVEATTPSQDLGNVKFQKDVQVASDHGDSVEVAIRMNYAFAIGGHPVQRHGNGAQSSYDGGAGEENAARRFPGYIAAARQEPIPFAQLQSVADAAAKNTAAATEAFDVLKGLDAAKKQKILEEAMADAAKSDALKKLGVTFADIKVAAKDADHTITLKVTFPGDKGAPPVTKDVTITRSATADGKEVVRDCKGEGLTSEQRYAIIAAASFQERVKLGGEVNTRIAISIKSTGAPGKDGLTDDERAAVKAYLAAGYTEVYSGKDNKCFTKADFKDLAAPDIRERPMQAWRAGAQGKPGSDVTFDNLMQLAKAIEGAVTEQGRARALKEFEAAATGYAKQCGGKAVEMVAEAVKKQADPQLADKVAGVVGAIEKASKEADPAKAKEETQKAMDDFNGHLKPSVAPTFDPGL